MFVYNARREDWNQKNDVSVFANFRIRPVHTYTYSYRIKNFHSGERFQKFPDTAVKYAGYVWTQAVFVKKSLRFHKFPDTCGHGLKELQVKGNLFDCSQILTVASFAYKQQKSVPEFFISKYFFFKSDFCTITFS